MEYGEGLVTLQLWPRSSGLNLKDMGIWGGVEDSIECTKEKAKLFRYSVLRHEVPITYLIFEALKCLK